MNRATFEAGTVLLIVLVSTSHCNMDQLRTADPEVLWLSDWLDCVRMADAINSTPAAHSRAFCVDVEGSEVVDDDAD